MCLGLGVLYTYWSWWRETQKCKSHCDTVLWGFGPRSHSARSTLQKTLANNGTHCCMWQCSHSWQAASKWFARIFFFFFFFCARANLCELGPRLVMACVCPTNLKRKTPNFFLFRKVAIASWHVVPFCWMNVLEDNGEVVFVHILGFSSQPKLLWSCLLLCSTRRTSYIHPTRFSQTIIRIWPKNIQNGVGGGVLVLEDNGNFCPLFPEHCSRPHALPWMLKIAWIVFCIYWLSKKKF